MSGNACRKKQGGYFATVPPQEILPIVNSRFESSVKGIFVIGDVTGLPLVKVAANQGVEIITKMVADHVFDRNSQDDQRLDLVIIGAGPAGLSAAVEAQKQSSKSDPKKATMPWKGINQPGQIKGRITTDRSSGLQRFPYRIDGKEFFDIEEHIYCGQTMSLNHIEHEIIRQRYQEPRVHVALVCAARSCPSIRPEAYVGKRLARQLEDQSIQFANDPRYVAYDASDSTLRLSPILKWYGDDWRATGGYLPWLAAKAKDPLLKQAIERAGRKEIRVAFFDYDWSLNAQTRQATDAATSTKKHADFGSGTVPNR